MQNVEIPVIFCFWYRGYRSWSFEKKLISVDSFNFWGQNFVFVIWSFHYSLRHRDIQQSNAQHNDFIHNCTQLYDILYDDIQYFSILQYDILHK